MGREHERAYRECGVDVVGRVTSADQVYTVCSAFVKGELPDYVSVCTHDDSHADYICAALAAGCKVIAEKPLCLTEDDLRRIYKLATPETLYCNLPLLEKEWPDGGFAGFIFADYNWGRADQLPGWRGNCPGYSFVLGAGVHTVSLGMMIKGRAIENIRGWGQKLNPEIDCETYISVDGAFVGGGEFQSHINCSDNMGHYHDIRIGHSDRTFTIRNYKTDKTAGIKRFISGTHDRYHNAVAAHSVCFAIERALKSGKRETVEYL